MRAYRYDIYDISGTTKEISLFGVRGQSIGVVNDFPSFTNTIDMGYSDLSLDITHTLSTLPSYIDYMKLIKVYVIKGSAETLIYQGWIEEIKQKLTGLISIRLIPINKLIQRLDYKDGSSYSVSHSSVTPDVVLKDIVDNFQSRNSSTYGNFLSYTVSSIPTINSSNISPTFTREKMSKAFQDTMEDIDIEGYHYRYGANGLVTVKQKPSSYTHTFNRLTHVIDGTLIGSVAEIINESYLDSDNLGSPSSYSDLTSQSNYGIVERTQADNRYSDTTHADAKVESDVLNNKDAKEGFIDLEINNNYDIESVMPLDTCRVVQMPAGIDYNDNNMLIVAVSYQGAKIKLSINVNRQVETLITDILDRNNKK